MNTTIAHKGTFVVPRKKLKKHMQPAKRKRRPSPSGADVFRPVHTPETRVLSSEETLHFFERVPPGISDDMDAEHLTIVRSNSAQAMIDRKVKVDGEWRNVYGVTKKKVEVEGVLTIVYGKPDRPGRNPGDPKKPVSKVPTAAEVLAEIRAG